MSPVSPLFGRSIKYSVIRFSIYSVLRIRSNGPPRGQTAKLIIIWYNFGVNHIPLQRNGMAAITKIDKIIELCLDVLKLSLLFTQHFKLGRMI